MKVIKDSLKSYEIEKNMTEMREAYHESMMNTVNDVKKSELESKTVYVGEDA